MTGVTCVIATTKSSVMSDGQVLPVLTQLIKVATKLSRGYFPKKMKDGVVAGLNRELAPESWTGLILGG